MKKLKILATIVSVMLASILVIVAGIYFMTRGDYQVAETVEMNSSIPKIEINGTKFHAETFGDRSNPTLIVLHGGPGHDYRSLLPLKKLSDEYFVLFYDQRGTGLSSRVEADELTVESSVADLAAIVDRYSYGRKVNLIGHSWGGVIATLYLAKNRERVDHLVLAEPPFLTQESAKTFRKKMRPEFSHRFLYGGLKLLFQSLHIDSPDSEARDDFFFAKYRYIQIDNNPLSGFDCGNDTMPQPVVMWRYGSAVNSAMLNDLAERDYTTGVEGGIKTFDDKVLFLTSECNRVTGIKHQAEHVKLFNNAEQIIVKGAGHNMFSEKAEESINAVRDYLNTPQ